MQGAYDPRKSKSDIRPEHNSANYFDAIINTAVDWFTPYGGTQTQTKTGGPGASNFLTGLGAVGSAATTALTISQLVAM